MKRIRLIHWNKEEAEPLIEALEKLLYQVDFEIPSGPQSDLTQQQVRESGLAHGLGDYKICSIDATWSGLLFTHRKK